ncbi:MarR family winged helix-turn-helix transcriptional regulator [Streptomyces sp. NPDC055134]
MPEDPTPDEVGAALLASVGLLVRRVRQVRVEGGELSEPERSALKQLDRTGPATSSDLARQAHITPQAMGATLSALQAAGLIQRRPDPQDGRRKVLSLTEAGARVLQEKRSARTDLLARALAEAFTQDELTHLAAAAPLIRRLAENI